MHETAPLLVQMTAIVVAVGILAQVIADRLRIPSIVLLLLFGILVGPDVLGWVDTAVYGAGLPAIVTVAVALILFEGGLQLHYVDLAAVGRSVRNLVTIGAAVTVAGAALAARYVVGFAWPLALLFGAIVSVTGPTVINPLLDRVRVKPRLDTLLRGEGILIDPIGAILAVVVLELIISVEATLVAGLLEFVQRLATGIAVGLVGGLLLGRLLRLRALFAEELKNLFVLAWVLLLFAVSEILAVESGLAAVVIAGMTIRREAIPQKARLRRFKGEMSVLFLSILFILLSAHLPVETLVALGWRGVWTVVLMMWVVRPLNILASTRGDDLSWRERLFAMWISPRGVVAISIASFIAIRMEAGSPGLAEAGLAGADGEALVALVFLTIAITVVVQGLSAGLVSRLLGVNAEAGRYAIVVGANPLGRVVAGLLQRYGWEALLIDANARNVQLARNEGLDALVGNSLDRQVHSRARLAEATALVSVTANQATNFLVARVARDEHHIPAVYPVLVDERKGAGEEQIEEIGGELAFGRRIDVAEWSHALSRAEARPVTVEVGEDAPRGRLADLNLPEGMLPVLTLRDGSASLCHGGTQWSGADRVVALVTRDAEARLEGIFRSAAAPGPEPAEAPS